MPRPARRRPSTLLTWWLLAPFGLAHATEAPETEAQDVLASPGAASRAGETADGEDGEGDGVADDSIQAWVQRFDGDPPEPALREALEERVEEALVERALADHLGGLDVPVDYYDDPERVLTGDPLQLDKLDMSSFDLPIELNGHVKKWMRLLLGPYRKYFTRWLSRKSKYEALIHAEADARGMPRDLVYLSMIESGFNPNAYSHAHAAGLWQFIPSTARMYGLEVDFWVDERRDPEKATKASLTMLSRLHDMFGDWYLAFAAYNTGPGRVRRALRSLEGAGLDEPATYWTLVERDLIAKETQGYVPKILAAAILAKHPELYGFDGLQAEQAFTYDTVEVEGRVDVDVLASCAGVDEDTFRDYNPALRRFATPDGTFAIRVPMGQAEAFAQALAEVPEDERQKLVMHRVDRGETLGTIAARYGTTVAAIVDTNRITNPNRVAIGQKLIIPVRGEGSATTAAPEPTRAAAATSHTVQRGDTLSAIAERHGLRLSDLVAYNGLGDAHHLQVGQVLRLTPPPAEGRPAPASAPTTQRPATYTVRPGDALSVIATRLGVSQDALAQANDLADPSDLKVGQVLTVPTGAGSPSTPSQTYTVRSGDALSRIASRHGVSTAELVSWNDLADASAIRVGQVLRVSPPAKPPPAPRRPVTYRVKAGDALSVIADRHGVSLSALQRENGIRDPSTIRVGQVLTIPGDRATAWSEHVVRSGESLGAIARQYGVTVSELQAWNGLSGATIFPGDRLKVQKR